MFQRTTKGNGSPAKAYRHPEADSPLRPEIGTQPQFRKRKPPATYRYDSSLSPALEWDGLNRAREHGEWLLAMIKAAASLPAPHTFDKPQEFLGGDGGRVATVHGLQDAVDQFRRLSQPFLNWAGKAERLSFDVPTLPLFVHERLSTKAIIETLKSHTKEARGPQRTMFELFADPQRPVTDQVLKAYEYRDKWVNRMILGDSLIVMNSLLHYEGLGGQVQMIYIDPPYGVKFGSNFQPFVKKRDVDSSSKDEEMTREPEMVKAYRDTWELGLHSYLNYLRDRLLLARDLLHLSGSIFVQINDENVHHVRSLLDDVFGPDNFIVTLILKKKGATTPTDPVNDYILWYAKDRERAKKKIRRIYDRRRDPEDDPKFNTLISLAGEMVRINDVDDATITRNLQEGWRWARVNYPIVSQHYHPERSKPYEFKGRKKTCGRDAQWRFEVPAGLDRLAREGRLFDGGGESLGGIVFWDDWPYVALSNVWNDLKGEEDPIYVVQTAWKAIQRCMLMTTAPGDLVLDPTCGSGTTAYIAEHWGRRWITIDTSRVPLALARQRMLTATFPYYQLKDESRGPVGGFVYARKQNRKGEEIGGIVPRITLKSIANDEPPQEEVLVDRPEVDNKITRVCGPFCVEAMISMPVDWDDDGQDGTGSAEEQASFLDRMLEVLRRSPILQLGGDRTVTLRNVRLPAKSLALSAEATVDVSASGETISLNDAIAAADERNLGGLPLTQQPVALVFGPENGAVSERLVFEAAREAHAKGYTHLYVIGFAIQPNARRLVEDCEGAMGVPATYVQATPDLSMGDLLKTMRSSQIFSVCGMPEIELRKAAPATAGGPLRYQVKLLGLDVFDPVTMQPDHLKGENVPAWLLDTDYNGLVFHGSQVFFPRTSAWESLKKALKATHDTSVWDHLAGVESAPFGAGEHGQIAVKVIDDRGNELLVVKRLSEAV